MNGIYISVHEQSKIDTPRNGHSFKLIILDVYFIQSPLYLR